MWRWKSEEKSWEILWEVSTGGIQTRARICWGVLPPHLDKTSFERKTVHFSGQVWPLTLPLQLKINFSFALLWKNCPWRGGFNIRLLPQPSAIEKCWCFPKQIVLSFPSPHVSYPLENTDFLHQIWFTISSFNKDHKHLFKENTNIFSKNEFTLNP